MSFISINSQKSYYNPNKYPQFQRQGGDFIEWENPKTKNKLIMVASGFGDGFYPSLIFNLTVHIRIPIISLLQIATSTGYSPKGISYGCLL